MLRSARNMIESGFSCLKARWRILLRPIDIPVEKLLNIIYACFVLHNFCEEAKGEVDAYLVEKIAQEERRAKLSVDKLNSYTSLAGRKVKETIISFFKEYLQFLSKKLTTQPLSDILYGNLVLEVFGFWI